MFLAFWWFQSKRISASYANVNPCCTAGKRIMVNKLMTLKEKNNNKEASQCAALLEIDILQLCTSIVESENEAIEACQSHRKIIIRL
jgi:hypothetical protein